MKENISYKLPSSIRNDREKRIKAQVQQLVSIEPLTAKFMQLYKNLVGKAKAEPIDRLNNLLEQ